MGRIGNLVLNCGGSRYGRSNNSRECRFCEGRQHCLDAGDASMLSSHLAFFQPESPVAIPEEEVAKVDCMIEFVERFFKLFGDNSRLITILHLRLKHETCLSIAKKTGCTTQAVHKSIKKIIAMIPELKSTLEVRGFETKKRVRRKRA